ncbi:MAG: hypothetical protein II998_00290 [Clostridia bacterium]|nr:hypothetical protein [Clostridia bacterium]
MKKLISFFSATLILVSALTLNISARTMTADETQISSVEIPDDYFVCTRSECDEQLNTIFENSGVSHEIWIEDVMKGPEDTNNIYIYGVTEDTQNYMFITFAEISSPEEDSGDGEHYLLGDFNMIEDKDSALESSKASLNINQGDIDSVEWIESDGCVTPYIRSVFVADNLYTVRYHTVYNGNQVVVQFNNKNPLTEEQLGLYAGVFESITYTETPDYEEAQNVIRDNEVKKSEKAQEIDRNSWIIIIIVVVVVIIAVCFGIYMATRKRRKSILKND